MAFNDVGPSDDEIIEEVIEFFEGNDDFDLDFVYSLQEKYEKYGGLTDAQREGLMNIYNRFNIGERNRFG